MIDLDAIITAIVGIMLTLLVLAGVSIIGWKLRGGYYHQTKTKPQRTPLLARLTCFIAGIVFVALCDLLSRAFNIGMGWFIVAGIILIIVSLYGIVYRRGRSTNAN